MADLIEEKKDKLGLSGAKLGKMLGVSGQAIGQYVAGAMPSLDFAIKWKDAFGENLIDLLFEEGERKTNLDLAAEPGVDEYITGGEQIQRMMDDLKRTMENSIKESKMIAKAFAEHEEMMKRFASQEKMIKDIMEKLERSK